MELYANYDFYVNEYSGSLDVSCFNKLIIDVTAEIKCYINHQLTDEELDNEVLNNVACRLVDLYHENLSKIKGISSESVDGVSISYFESSNDEFKNQKQKIINCLPKDWLTWI